MVAVYYRTAEPYSAEDPPARVEVVFATFQLGTPFASAVIDAARRILEPALTLVGAALPACRTLVVGEVLVVRVPLGDADRLVRVVGVPADEIDGVIEIVAVGKSPSRIFLVRLPGALECLRIAVGIGRAFPRDEDFFAALYQPRFSSKIAQMFSTFSGGVVAQLASSSMQGATSTARTATARFLSIFQYFLEKLRTLLFRLINSLQTRV